MVFKNILGEFAITDLIGIYNAILNQQQIKNELNNNDLAKVLIECTNSILSKLNEQDEYLYGNVVKTEKTDNMIGKGEQYYMLLVSYLTDDMEDELDGACHYYKMANKIKNEYPDMARRYIELAKTELTHATTLHQMAVTLIEDMKSKMKEDIPEYMQEYYNKAHEEYVEDYDELSYKINKFSL